MTGKYKIGDMVTVYFGKIPMTGAVVFIDEKEERYLVRFNATQQMYYKEEELLPYSPSEQSQ